MEFIVAVAILWGMYKFAQMIFASKKPAPPSTKTTVRKTTSNVASPTFKSAEVKSTSLPKTKSSSAKKVATPSKTRTYSGPLFAQEGEKGKLFGFAGKSGLHELDGPFAIIDLETSGFNPQEAKFLKLQS